MPGHCLLTRPFLRHVRTMQGCMMKRRLFHIIGHNIYIIHIRFDSSKIIITSGGSSSYRQKFVLPDSCRTSRIKRVKFSLSAEEKDMPAVPLPGYSQSISIPSNPNFINHSSAIGSKSSTSTVIGRHFTERYYPSLPQTIRPLKKVFPFSNPNYHLQARLVIYPYSLVIIRHMPKSIIDMS